MPVMGGRIPRARECMRFVGTPESHRRIIWRTCEYPRLFPEVPLRQAGLLKIVYEHMLVLIGVSLDHEARLVNEAVGLHSFD